MFLFTKIKLRQTALAAFEEELVERVIQQAEWSPESGSAARFRDLPFSRQQALVREQAKMLVTKLMRL